MTIKHYFMTSSASVNLRIILFNVATPWPYRQLMLLIDRLIVARPYFGMTEYNDCNPPGAETYRHLFGLEYTFKSTKLRKVF